MRKTATAAAPQSDSADEHHLVVQLRQAMARKDIITMGRMLEMLGTMHAELEMGRPVIDALASRQGEPTGTGAPVTDRKPSPAGTPAARVSR